MSNMGYGKSLTVTNMQMIITKIGCRIGQSSKIRCNVLVRIGVWEQSAAKNVTNNKVGKGLLATTLKLCTMWSYVVKGEAQLTFDILLRKPVSRPLSRPRGASVLLLVALSLVGRSRGIEATVVKLVLVVVAVAVGTPVATRTAPVTVEIGVVLRCGKVSRRCW